MINDIYPTAEVYSHQILDAINNCYFHPKLDDHFHPLWMFIVSFCPSVEKSVTKHQILDEFDAMIRNIQKWMIVGHQ